jgi:ribosome maturation factor RimP
MILKSDIERLVTDKIAGSDMFIVEISVRPGNKVEVLLDKDSGMTIEDCTEVHRFLVKQMEEAGEDIELEVSSPGVGQPLKIKRQYVKNVGRPMKVKLTDGRKVDGLLTAANDAHIVLTYEVREEIPGKKAKKKVQKEDMIPHEHIVEAKIVITFK